MILHKHLGRKRPLSEGETYKRLVYLCYNMLIIKKITRLGTSK